VRRRGEKRKGGVGVSGRGRKTSEGGDRLEGIGSKRGEGFRRKRVRAGEEYVGRREGEGRKG